MKRAGRLNSKPWIIFGAIALAITPLAAWSQISRSAVELEKLRQKFNAKNKSMVEDYRTIQINKIETIDPLIGYVPAVYFGTQEVRRVGQRSIQCNRCNDNKVSSFVDTVMDSRTSNCSQKYLIADSANLATQAIVAQGGYGFYYRHAYQCPQSPLPAFLEQRMGIDQPGFVRGQPVAAGSVCSLQFRNGDIFIIVKGVPVTVRYGPDVKIEFKEFLHVPVQDFNGPALPQSKSFNAFLNTQVFSDTDKRILLSAKTDNNSPVSLSSIALTRPAQYESLRIEFEQNAPVKLNLVSKSQRSAFGCALEIGKNGFNGIVEIERNKF